MGILPNTQRNYMDSSQTLSTDGRRNIPKVVIGSHHHLIPKSDKDNVKKIIGQYLGLPMRC